MGENEKSLFALVDALTGCVVVDREGGSGAPWEGVTREEVEREIVDTLPLFSSDEKDPRRALLCEGWVVVPMTPELLEEYRRLGEKHAED